MSFVKEISMTKEDVIKKIFGKAFEGEPVDGNWKVHPSKKLLNEFIRRELSIDDACIVAGHIATCNACSIRIGKLRREAAKATK